MRRGLRYLGTNHETLRALFLKVESNARSRVYLDLALMACRVPITDVAKAIHCLEEDGGVIVTGFATVEEVNTVNDDAAPYLEAVANEVAPPKMCSARHH